MPSTAAQMFHLLRRQAIRNNRTPLIVITPKSLLRNKYASSNIDELTLGKFEYIFDDESNLTKKLRKVILCSGKIYHDLKKQKMKTIKVI